MLGWLTDRPAVESATEEPLAALTLAYDGVPVVVTLAPKRKQAVGRYRGGVVAITVPKRWPQPEQIKAAQSLARRLVQQVRAYQAMAVTARTQYPCLTMTQNSTLDEYVTALNNTTYQVPISVARIGGARHSRLAQINLKNRVITVSKYCLHQVPEPALRYLICHELAHTFEANHSPRFWRQVATHCPDWKRLSKIMQAIHAVNVALLDT